VSNSNKLNKEIKPKLGTLRIGEISKRTGIKIVTLRFYEAQGLLPKASPKARHRRYSEDILTHIQFITAAREVGLSLPEIRGLLEILKGIKPPALKLMKRLRDTATEVDQKISHLHKIKKLLRQALEDPTQSQI